MRVSEGQKLALTQLDKICEATEFAVDYEILIEPNTSGDPLVLLLSLSTKHHIQSENGFKFKPRESLELTIDHRFPVSIPSVEFSHHRFMGKPHVFWGNWICLYLTPDTEWNPRDGMMGFIERLNEWMSAAAKNKLDPENAPLHPPVTSISSEKCVVVKADISDLNKSDEVWIGYALFSKRNSDCYDLTEWVTLSELHTGFNFSNNDKFFAPVILFNSPLSIHYPRNTAELTLKFIEMGVGIELLKSRIALLSLQKDKNVPSFIVVGAPMRRIEKNGELRQHLTVWEIDREVIEFSSIAFDKSKSEIERKQANEKYWEWLKNSKVKWCRVQENRQEVTIRRDDGTYADWLFDKRILLLGCGAIGSHIAENIARANPSHITLVDNKFVTIGSLVRQQYSGKSVGRLKSFELKNNLEELMFDIEIKAEICDLRFELSRILNLNEFDLIIDATASNRVEFAFEIEHIRESIKSPIVSISISSKAEYGNLIFRKPGHSNGQHSLSRRAKIKAYRNPKLNACAEKFWPTEDSETLFQPEPGCSEPTFVASNTDIAWFSASFLNSALKIQTKLSHSKAISVYIDKNGSSLPSTVLSDSTNFKDELQKYNVHLYPEALKVIYSAIEKNRRLGIEDHETGGYLFGEIDEVLKCSWVDYACGPPPDSIKKKTLFLTGIKGISELSESYFSKTGKTSKLIGLWHTHTHSTSTPSPKDLSTIIEIFHDQIIDRRQILLLIVGTSATNPDFGFYLLNKEDFV